VKQEEVAIAKQWHGKHISAATNHHATIEQQTEDFVTAVVIVIYRVCNLVRQV
jgi:hypothetical protein